MALSIWRQHMVEEIAKNHGDKLFNEMSQNILLDRDGQSSNPRLVLEVCRSFGFFSFFHFFLCYFKKKKN